MRKKTGETVYWEEPGEKNTSETLDIALKTAKKEKLNDIVLASNSGSTTRELLEKTKKMEGLEANIVCVTHHVGYREPGRDEMAEDVRSELKSQGVDVLTTTHVLAGVARSIKKKQGGLYPAEIMAQALRMLSEGIKVGVEISIMALDAGLVPYGEDIMAIGGTGNGADTACKIRPGHSNEVFETELKEIYCRPKG